MTEHTQTPWRVKMYDQGEIGVRQDCGLGFAICNLVQQDMDAGQPETTANAERIITCVNRCEGLTNKELAKYNLAAVAELVEIAKSYKAVCNAKLRDLTIGHAIMPGEGSHLNTQAQMAKWQAELRRVTKALKNIEASQ